MHHHKPETLPFRLYLLAGLPILMSAFLLPSCLPPEPAATQINISLEDPIQRQIMDLQDRQQKDSLYLLLHAAVPEHRYLAARAFASIQAPESLDSLAPLLADPVPEIRAMSAFAIGQLGKTEAIPYLSEAFNRGDTEGKDGYFNRAILEAVGKCGGEKELALLSSIRTYQATDTLLLEGQALGIYRLALKSVTSPEGTARMLELATSPVNPPVARLIAAHYLARVPELSLDGKAGSLREALSTETDPDIAMALVSGLAKTKSPDALAELSRLFDATNDHRIKTNIITALGNFDYAQTKELALTALRDDHWAVRERATNYLLIHGTTLDAPLYRQLARDTLPPMEKIALYRAALRHLPDTSITAKSYLTYEIRRNFNQSSQPYEKARMLVAMAEFPWNYRSIAQLGVQDTHPAVRVAAVEALKQISDSEKFSQYFGTGLSIRRSLLQYFLQAIQSEDPGMMAVASQALVFPEANYNLLNPDIELLNSALDKLELPKEIETWYELSAAIAFLKGESPETSRRIPEFSHPIDWSIEGLTHPEPRVSLVTNKGNIALTLYPELAPGSVANFLELSAKGFFDNKVFHRTVPNFVIQGGCPRGDGYGSLDYAIRSELPPIYYHEEGLLGMASAGNHTEGTQFFITHSPTPHLDGRYTIFGKVTEGMEYVHQIAIGDTIKKVSLDSRFNQ